MSWQRKSIRAAMSLVLVPLALAHDVQAQDATTEARFKLLEQRIIDLEKQLKAAQSASAGAKQGAATPSATIQAPPTVDPAVLAEEEKKKKAAEEGRKARKEAEAAEAKAPTKEKPSSQAVQLFRDNAPTLSGNQLEVSADVNYTRGTGLLQADRAINASLSARYGISNGFEVGVTVPYFDTSRETTVFGGRVVEGHYNSIGDITFQVLKTLWDQKPQYPGAALSVGLVTPTGESLYSFKNYAGGDPRSFEEQRAARGMWAANYNLQFYQTFDPVIFFFGFGNEYAFEKEFEGGHTVQPGWRTNYNFGLSLALSEYTTLGFQVLGSVEQQLRVDGVKMPARTAEQMRGRFSIIHRLDTDLYLEPSVAIGLTDDTPDAAVGFSVRKRM